MILIIMHHCVVHGGGMNMEPCNNKWIALVFVPIGKICFDTFIAISAWFLVDSTFKAQKMMKLFTEVLFYSVFTTVLAIIYTRTFSIDELSCLLPMTGGVQGYAQTYLVFYFIFPFLKKVSDNMTERQNKLLLYILSICVVGSRVVSVFINFSEQSVYSRLGLFIYFYFIARYLKKYKENKINNAIIPLIIFLGSWGAAFLFYYGGTIHPEYMFWEKLSVLIGDEGTLVNIIGGMALFFVFKNIKIKYNRVLNMFAGTTLAVIMIHDGHYFRSVTWSIFKTTEWWYSQYYLLFMVMVAVSIYFACAVIDILRKRFIEKPLFECSFMKRVVNVYDLFLEEK